MGEEGVRESMGGKEKKQRKKGEIEGVSERA